MTKGDLIEERIVTIFCCHDCRVADMCETSCKHYDDDIKNDRHKCKFWLDTGLCTHFNLKKLCQETRCIYEE